MAKVEINQLTFNGGELDPALHDRTDLAKYYGGVERAENFVMRQHGGAYKRPGTHLIGEALETDKPVRLVPFRFSMVQAYILEFGDRRMRVIKDDAFIVYPAGHAKAGQIVVIDTPYAATDLARLSLQQTADLLVIAHSSYRLRRLKRYDHHDWRFEEFDFGQSTVATPKNLRFTADGKNDAAYCVSALDSANVESNASDMVVCAQPVGTVLPMPNTAVLTIEQCHQLWVTEYKQVWPSDSDVWAEDYWTTYNFLFNNCGYYDPWYDGGHIKFRRPNGVMVDTGFAAVNIFDEGIYALENNLGDNNVLNTMRSRIKSYVEKNNDAAGRTGVSSLSWSSVSGAKKYNIYRASNLASNFYLIGTSSTTSFTDNKLAANTAKTPIESNNDFADVSANPGVCAFFEQRLVLARTNDKPTTFWGSVIGNFGDFTKHSPIQEDDSYSFTLDSGEMNEILWMLPLNDILFGTAGSEWRAGGGGQAITPTNITARSQSMYGCAPIQPIIVGRSAIFVGASRRVIRDMAYSLEADGFDGEDLTLFASHLFESRTIVSMCYQKEPVSVIWVVMSDGALLSCTYLPNQRVVSWSRHTTAGRFEDCISLRDVDGTDRVYFTVTRDAGIEPKRFVEVMLDPIVPSEDITEAFYVDCGLSYRGEETKSLSGLDHLEGRTVAIVADGSYSQTQVRDGRIDLEYPARVVHVGLEYAAELITLDLQNQQQPVTMRPRDIVTAEISLAKSVQCRVGPRNSRGDEIIMAEGEGWPTIRTRRYPVNVEPADEADGFVLRLRSETPYPLCVIAINAVGGAGGV